MKIEDLIEMLQEEQCHHPGCEVKFETNYGSVAKIGGVEFMGIECLITEKP